jgi:hypothetical protein
MRGRENLIRMNTIDGGLVCLEVNMSVFGIAISANLPGRLKDVKENITELRSYQHTYDPRRSEKLAHDEKTLTKMTQRRVITFYRTPPWSEHPRHSRGRKRQAAK